MPCEPDHLLLRRYADARDRGDLATASELWKQLAVNNFDRVTQIVKAFRFSPGGPGLPEHEWGSAASEAYLRVVAMGAGFRKREVGQFYAALVTCVQNACKDYGRKELRHQRRARGSLEATYEPDGEAGPFDAVLDRLRRAATRADRRCHRRGAQPAGGRDARGVGHQQVTNDNYREVLELTYLHKIPPRTSPSSSTRTCRTSTRAAAAASRNWRRSFVTFDRERILSEFIDAWNAGQRPNVDEYIARAARWRTGRAGRRARRLPELCADARLRRRGPGSDPRRADRRRGAGGERRASRAAARAARRPARTSVDDDRAGRRRPRLAAGAPERARSKDGGLPGSPGAR